MPDTVDGMPLHLVLQHLAAMTPLPRVLVIDLSASTFGEWTGEIAPQLHALHVPIICACSGDVHGCDLSACLISDYRILSKCATLVWDERARDRTVAITEYGL